METDRGGYSGNWICISENEVGQMCTKNFNFSKFIIFCSEIEKMNKEIKESIVNIALASDAPIGYNVVTKVTSRCF